MQTDWLKQLTGEEDPEKAQKIIEGNLLRLMTLEKTIEAMSSITIVFGPHGELIHYLIPHTSLSESQGMAALEQALLNLQQLVVLPAKRKLLQSIPNQTGEKNGTVE